MMEEIKEKTFTKGVEEGNNTIEEENKSYNPLKEKE